MPLAITRTTSGIADSAARTSSVRFLAPPGPRRRVASGLVRPDGGRSSAIARSAKMGRRSRFRPHLLDVDAQPLAASAPRPAPIRSPARSERPSATPPATRRRTARAPAPCRRGTPPPGPASASPPRAPSRRRGIALVRHARGSATAFRNLTDLGLHQQRNVARDLAEHRGVHAASPRSPPGDPDGCARVPRQPRSGPVAAPPRTALAERRARPRRSPELQDERRRRQQRDAPPPRDNAATQPAAFRPKVIGVAGCRSVRPASRSSMRLRQRPQRAVDPRMFRREQPSPASESTIAVSATSWLVAPKWTKSALFGSRDRTCVASAARTDRHRACAACRAGDLGGSRPSMRRARNRRGRAARDQSAAASARASAISKSSIAWSSDDRRTRPPARWSWPGSRSGGMTSRQPIRDRRTRFRRRPEDECRTAMPRERSRAQGACAGATRALAPEPHRSR